MNKILRTFMTGGMVGLLALAGQEVRAGAGTTGAEVLRIPLGARAIGMGEAFTAQADDVSSLYWNPAGLALMQERQASFMYDQAYQGMRYQNGNVGIPLESGALGASLSYLNYGSISGYDEAGNSIGSQSAYSGVATLGGAWLGNQWALGANVKGIQQKLADVKANGAAFDIGGIGIYPKPVLGGTIRLGAVMQHLGSGMKFEQQKDPMPTTWRAGLAAVQMLDRKLNISLDYVAPKSENGYMAGGAEYWVLPFVALRGGFINTKTEGSGLRAGLGLRVRKISFDYAYAGQGELGMSHRYELSFRFGEPRPILSAEENRIFQQAKAAMRQGRFEQATLLLDSVIEMAPRFKPARRYINVAMSKLEGQQSQALARQGKMFQPGAETALQKPALPEMDDLEALLNLTTPRAAQAPAGNPKATVEER